MSKFRICKRQEVWWLDCPNGVAMPCGSWHVARLRFKQELASWCPMCHRFAARPTDPITGWRECSKCGAEFNGSGLSSGRTTRRAITTRELLREKASS